jgi:hypothetical protein
VGKLELSDFELHLLEQGNEVEAEACKLFPEALPVTATGDGAVEETVRLMQAKTPTILQATFVAEGFIAKNDMLAYDPTKVGTRLPQHALYFEEFNKRIYDLMDIFHDQHYVHHGFRGKCSIKKVLPTLDAELRYDGLDIQEGGQAADAWWRMVTADTAPEEKAKIAHDLKVYCGLDTYAMYAIWHHLQEAISEVAVPVRSMYAPIHSAAA